jgi:hypothetical protein
MRRKNEPKSQYKYGYDWLLGDHADALDLEWLKKVAARLKAQPDKTVREVFPDEKALDALHPRSEQHQTRS